MRSRDWKVLVWSAVIIAISYVVPIHAQNQPSNVACSVEGPTIQDTITYINNAASRADSVLDNGDTSEPTRVSIEDGKLVLMQNFIAPTSDGISSSIKHAADIRSLKCPQVDFVSYPNSNARVFVTCSSGNCFEESHTRNVDSQWYYLTARDHWDIFVPSCDSDCVVRLARAVSHLIAMTQQQVKDQEMKKEQQERDRAKQYNNSNDPFAKPQ